METQVGVVKQISGLVVAVDQNGVSRVLQAGDALYLGEVIKTSSASSKAVVAMDNGKDVTILGDESLRLDENIISEQNLNTMADVTDLQKALLNGEDLTSLEETAAGGNAAAGGGDGVSLGAASFEHGGHYSNISASTSAINPLNTASLIGGNEGVRGGVDDVTANSSGTGVDISTPSANGGNGNGGNNDVTPAHNPSINSIDNDDTKVTGKVDNPEKNTTVTVTFPDGSTATTTVDNNGKWEVPTPNNTPLKPGETVTAIAQDKGGKSDPVNSNEVIGITRPIIKEVWDDVAEANANPRKIENGSKSNDSTPTIKGTAAANSEVSIFDNGTFIGKTTSDKNGNFTFESSALKDGSHTFTAKTQYSEKSEGFSFTVDTQASIDMTVSDAEKGKNGHYIATVSGSVKDVESGNIVTVTSPNGAETKSVVTADGRYTATIDYGTTPPAKGSAVKVSVNDEAGNKAENKVSLDLSIEQKPVPVQVSVAQTIAGKVQHLSGNAFRYIDKTHNALDIFDNRGYGGKINKTGDITKELQDGKVLNPQVVAEEYGKTGRMGAAINPRPEQQNSSLFPKREDGQTSRGPIDRTQTINKLEFGDLTGKMSRPGYTNSRSNSDVVYYYKGKVTISGVRDQIFATASKGTVAIVKIDGKIVLAQKDDGHNVKTVQKLNGLHDIEVIVIKDSNHISGNVKVGVIGTNGKEVVLGDQSKYGVETHLISPNAHIPSNYHFNPDNGKFETITYKPEVKVKGGSSDHSNETQDQDSNHDINVEESKMTNGTDKADTINGSDKGEYIDGGKGNDTINGGAGNDHIEGGDGDDIINAGAGNDYINGGAGKDTINAGDGDDVIVFDKNDTKIDGGAGKDTLVLSDVVDFTKLGELKNKVTNIENLELNSQGGKPVEVTLNVKDVLDLTGENNADAKIDGINTLKIDGHNGDKVSLKGEGEDWSKKGGVTSDGYVTYEGKDANNHTVHIQIKEDVTIDL